MSTWVRALAVVSLAWMGGCPRAGDASSSGGEVHARQTWRFRVDGVGEQVYEVTAVTATDVEYLVRTVVDGAPIGEPLAQRFPRSPGPGPLESGEAGAPLVLGELRLDTWITTQGTDRVTTAVSGRSPRFPGVLKVERGDDVILELVDVR
jgi:hypothetical protein